MTILEQQQAILDAATALLASGGPQALRVRDIADAADCTTMAVYSRFGGKDGIVEAIYVDGFRRFADAMRTELSGPDDDRTIRMGQVYRSWALANPGSYQIMFTEAVPGFAPSAEAGNIAFESFAVLQGAVAHDQAAGRLRSGGTPEIAWALWGVAHGLVMLELAGMQPDSSDADPAVVYLQALQASFDGFRPL